MTARSVFDRPAPVLAAYGAVSGGIAVAAAVLAGWTLRHFLDGPVVTVVQVLVGVVASAALGWYADVLLESWYNRRRRS